MCRDFSVYNRSKVLRILFTFIFLKKTKLMHKFWELRDSKANKLILIKDKTIYKGNPKRGELNKLRSEFGNLGFLDHLFSIPYSYIKRIENQKGKNEIKIFYGKKSEEELIVNDENIKKDIFEFLKKDIPDFQNSSELPSIFKYAKPQFYALLFTSLLFIWTLHYATEIEKGIEYELVGKPGLGALVFGVANFGVFKVTAGYIVLLCIIIYVLVKKLKSRSKVEILKRI